MPVVTSLGDLSRTPHSTMPGSLSHSPRREPAAPYDHLRYVFMSTPFVALPLILLIRYEGPSHGHPHTHEERFQWQTTVLLNILVIYLALETASPLALLVMSRMASLPLDIAIHCFYIATLFFSASLLIPVEFYEAAGDVHLRRSHMTVLYAGLALVALIRVVSFARTLARVET